MAQLLHMYLVHCIACEVKRKAIRQLHTVSVNLNITLTHADC